MDFGSLLPVFRGGETYFSRYEETVPTPSLLVAVSGP